jgi:hypothetical protein
MIQNTQATLADPLGLDEARVKAALKRLHDEAKHDPFVLPRLIPALLIARLKRVPLMTAVQPLVAKGFLAVTPEVGRPLYLTARAIGARNVVEFGRSFGAMISSSVVPPSRRSIAIILADGDIDVKAWHNTADFVA